MTNKPFGYRTIKSIDELFSNGIKSELDMLTLINYSMECRGTLRHVMNASKVWKNLFKQLQKVIEK